MTATQPLPHAAVRFPPPFLFAAGWLIGWALEVRVARIPLAPPGAAPALEWLGMVLLVAGLALSFWGMITFRSARTSIIPNRPASRIVTDGPYRFSRNPMYVGLTVAYSGLALTANTAWPLILLPGVLLLLIALVILREERYLEGAFGTEYAAYRARVRRWL